MEYQVVQWTATHPKQIEKMVALQLTKGWKLQGGISVTHTGSKNSVFNTYAQAMTKED